MIRNPYTKGLLGKNKVSWSVILMSSQPVWHFILLHLCVCVCVDGTEWWLLLVHYSKDLRLGRLVPRKNADSRGTESGRTPEWWEASTSRGCSRGTKLGFFFFEAVSDKRRQVWGNHLEAWVPPAACTSGRFRFCGGHRNARHVLTRKGLTFAPGSQQGWERAGRASCCHWRLSAASGSSPGLCVHGFMWCLYFLICLAFMKQFMCVLNYWPKLSIQEGHILLSHVAIL